MSNYDVSELQRVISNLVRIGVVEELDEANARVKVRVSGLLTDWLPWGADSAGRVRKWSPKQEGEQVVLFAPGGDMAQAVVGHSLFQDDHPAPAGSKFQETTTYPDGSTVDFNSKTNTLTVNVAGGGNVVVNCKVATVKAATSVTVETATATVKASTSVTVDTPDAHFTGNIKADGEIADKVRAMSADRLIYNSHTHPNNAASPPTQRQ